MAEEWAERSYADLGVRFFPAAPANFDPVQASADELRTYGYPPRPDPELHPDLFGVWSRAVSPSMTTIEPRFGVVPRPVVPPGPALPGPPPVPSRGTSPNWAGSVNFPNINDAVVSVAACWVVPDITGPDMMSGDYCVEWVGIDGVDPTTGEPVSPDVVQAGTTQLIDDSLRQRTWAWWEWAPANPQPIGTSLPVGPGDQMYCVVRALTPTLASFYLANLTRQVRHPPFQKPAPNPGYPCRGESADWIVEWPQGTARLADFGSVEFQNCVATTTSESVLWAGRGQILTMVSVYNTDMAIAKALSDSQIEVDYNSSGSPPPGF